MVIVACSRRGGDGRVDAAFAKNVELNAHDPDQAAHRMGAAAAARDDAARDALSPRNAEHGAAETSAAKAAAPIGKYNLGLNLDGLSYFMEYVPFADIARSLCTEDPITCWERDDKKRVAVDAQGYPLTHGRSVSDAPNPPGQYTVEWDGAGKVSVGGQPLSPLLSSANHHVATFAHESGRIAVEVVAPVSNLHIWAPGSDRHGLYSKRFLRRMQPFSTVRFMDLLNTNASVVSRWDERAKPDDFSYATTRGVPYEIVNEFAKTTGKDVWINIPSRATDNFVCRLARLLRYGEPGERSDAGCDPSTPGAGEGVPRSSHIYVEYSNEQWNSFFPIVHLHYCMANGRKPPKHDTPCPATRPYMQSLRPYLAQRSIPWSRDDWPRASELMALTMRQVAKTFRSVFADRPEQISTVLNTQAAWTGAAETSVEFLERAFGAGTARSVYDYVAVAPYLNIAEGDDVDGATPDTFLAALHRELDHTMPVWLERDKEFAAKYRIPLIAYEGGQGLSGGKNRAVKIAAQGDPRMYDVYRRFFSLWSEKIGEGKLICHYAYASRYDGDWGQWGAFDDDTKHGSHKWDALVSLLRRPGDANLDGRIDASDCALVSANAKETMRGAWWEDGDFDHDGLVSGREAALACP